MITKKKLKIGGMHCSACALNINFDLEDLDGVKSAKTSYARCECEIEFDPGKIKDKDLIEVVKKAGYTVVDV